MYVIREDAEILCSDEVAELKRKYRKRFGEGFICFNYADFPGTETQKAADMYLETLREAVKADKPYCIEHR